MRAQKGQTVVLVLVGIVVLAAVSGGAYYLINPRLSRPQTQNPVVSPASKPVTTSQPISTSQSASALDETANWKTYTNDKFKISFKYPVFYTITEYGGNSVFFTRTTKEKQFLEDCFARKQPECNNYPLRISFDNPERSSNASLKDFIALYTHSDVSGYLTKTLSGFPALQKQFEGVGIVNNTFVDRGNTILYIQGNSIINAQENIGVFNRILSTFRFIDQNQTISNTASGEKGITLEEARQIEPLYPAKLTLSQSGNTKILQWEGTGEDAGYYQLYRKTGTNQKWVSLTKVQIQGDNRGSYEYKDSTVQPDLSYIYGISFVNSLGTESKIIEGDTK